MENQAVALAGTAPTAQNFALQFLDAQQQFLIFPYVMFIKLNRLFAASR
jgi:hypothetical protein